MKFPTPGKPKADTKNMETYSSRKASNTIGGRAESQWLSYLFTIIYMDGLELTGRRIFGKLDCIVLRKTRTACIFKSLVSLAIASAILVASGCAVRRTTKVVAPELSAPPAEASLEDLVARVNALDSGIQSFIATVDFQPTAGSVYSGVIKEYHDVKGFILVKKPAMIRVIGQAPVIRTDIFDMVSDGKTFRLNVPPKHKFIVGPTALTRPSKNTLENMRPQHILDAMLVPPINMTKDKVSNEQAEENSHRYYVLTVFQPGDGAELFPMRKVWFDRSNLDIARMQWYGPKGSYIEDVQYSDFKDFQGTRYPALVQITRPVEDYRLAITIQRATFNQEIAPDKFELKKPDGAELVELSDVVRPEVEHGK